jgi:hypothetical protein
LAVTLISKLGAIPLALDLANKAIRKQVEHGDTLRPRLLI